MIAGLGTDIVEIARIEAALQRTPRLAERILTADELVAYQSSNNPARFLAKRFAAKEAAVKALGTGIGRGVGWQQLSVSHADSGRPLIAVTGTAGEIAASRRIGAWHLSYSDEQHYVIATVIAEILP
ncbi:Holo-[acyl-carrier protein] synthase [Marinobacterium lacunae]|uniref:Holo-[acyl-carrier-protein] synthase n=1 Tax=Marinobacterium lacunae TaxID=1232683 RepID=A0A081G464_9GAMM|nr:holo-ACP synthase [Marinobacterium lacunae]KEA65569.1 Holo-[acyl-carrier protein] synthase [Marinobacterium lacunae]MBR9884076.1 holo-ACP synthase [Oceanospirillales bacterium]